MHLQATKAESSPVEEDPFVNPHYKCSVKLNEIPEVPVNRFLMRGPPAGIKKNSDEASPDVAPAVDDYESIPIEVDLSKFEDIPDEPDVGEEQSLANPSSGLAGVLKSQVKATEPLVSKSGRIMKGRGTFKFRTPSPDTDRPYRERQQYRHHRSPIRRHRDRAHDDDYRSSRRRSRSRSPVSHMRHDDRSRSGRR